MSVEKINKQVKMSTFGQNLLAFAKKNLLSGTDVCKHFGWHSNAYRNYTQDDLHPNDEGWHQIVQKTGIPKSEWMYTLLTDEEIPGIKFQSAIIEKRMRMVEEDIEMYGPLLKLDSQGLAQKLADLQMRIEKLEKINGIAKE